MSVSIAAPRPRGVQDQSPAASARPVAEAAVEVTASSPARVPLSSFMLAYLKLGCTSIGGRSASYLMDELVYRRGWLKREDWQEGLSLGLLLPGPVGASCAMFLSTLLRGPRGAPLAHALYVLPGVLIALVLSVLIFGMPRPPWANGAIAALSASAFGLFFYVTVRNLPTSRKTLWGPIFTVIAFVAYALLEANLLVVLIGVGAVSVLINRPNRSKQPKQDRSPAT